MKLFGVLAFALAAFAAVNPQLHQIKRIYILAMGSGMDQYLANQLTKAGLFEVVTDPKKADALVTDNIGETFERKFDDLYAPPPEPKPPADDKTSDAPAPKKDAFDGIDFSGGGFRPSSVARGKGNYFVVDRASRAVLWSVYERPKNSSPQELEKTAARVVKHLQSDLTNKAQ